MITLLQIFTVYAFIWKNCSQLIIIFFFLQVTYLHMDYSSDLQQLEPII